MDQWSPDSDERLRVVARLSFALQEGGYRISRRSTIVASRSALRKLLPAEGNWRGRQDLFLNWLVITAGLLNDRGDGTLAFSHLSFQEFLAAYHLKVTLAGDAELHTLADDPDWWETLMLWAALAGGENAERAQKMIEALLASTESRSRLLAGMMLADGLGTREQLSSWAGSLIHLAEGGSGLDDRVARAFAASRQESWRATLLTTLDQEAARSGWMLWERLAHFVELVEPGRKVREPGELVPAAVVAQLAGREQEKTSAPPWLAAWPERTLFGHCCLATGLFCSFGPLGGESLALGSSSV